MEGIMRNRKRLSEIRREIVALERLGKATSSKGLKRRVAEQLAQLQREARALEPRKAGA